jgi:hypothetical protein
MYPAIMEQPVQRESRRCVAQGPANPPLDLSHHFSDVTRHRLASKMKEYYKFFMIPGIGNLAGGWLPVVLTWRSPWNWALSQGQISWIGRR